MRRKNSGVQLMKRTASENKYLHRDFHQSMNLLLEYIYRNFGKENLIKYLKQFTHEYHKPLHKQLKDGNIQALILYFNGIYKKEEWPVIIREKDNSVEIEQKACPGISYIKSLGKVPCSLYVETYRTVYSTLCADTPFEYKLNFFDEETGACKQLFRKTE